MTPENYVEGPFMLKRNGKYYFMWSEGGWTGPKYAVAYAIADSPMGPFNRIGRILHQIPAYRCILDARCLQSYPTGDDDKRCNIHPFQVLG